MSESIRRANNEISPGLPKISVTDVEESDDLEAQEKVVSLEELARLGEGLTATQPQAVAGTTLLAPRLSTPTIAITDDFARILYKIRANLGEMRRMSGRLGSEADSHELRAKLNALTEVTKEMIMRANFDLKRLSNRVDVGRESTRITRMTREFQQLMGEFQSIQRVSLERCREFVRIANTVNSTKLNNEEEFPEHRAEIKEEREPLIQTESTLQSGTVRPAELQHEIAYNEALIQEREQGIEEIEATMAEVQEIFGAMGLMVSEQQGYVDNIEANMEAAAARTTAAVRELTTARERRRRRRSNLMFLMFLVIFIVILILAFINAIL